MKWWEIFNNPLFNKAELIRQLFPNVKHGKKQIMFKRRGVRGITKRDRVRMHEVISKLTADLSANLIHHCDCGEIIPTSKNRCNQCQKNLRKK